MAMLRNSLRVVFILISLLGSIATSFKASNDILIDVSRREVTCTPLQEQQLQLPPAVGGRTACHGVSDPGLCATVGRARCCELTGALEICLVLCETCPETIAPSTSPTIPPTAAPTSASPSTSPTFSPTTSDPTVSPTLNPTSSNPTRSPSMLPTTPVPTSAPTIAPSTPVPTQFPTDSPTQTPTQFPSISPSTFPTKFPSMSPTQLPTTSTPTSFPTSFPSASNPTAAPMTYPPTASPTQSPTSSSPTTSPTSNSPTVAPSNTYPTVSPTGSPVTSLCSNLGSLDIVLAFFGSDTETISGADIGLVSHLIQLLPVTTGNVRLGWVSNLESSQSVDFTNNKSKILSSVILSLEDFSASTSKATSSLDALTIKIENSLLSRSVTTTTASPPVPEAVVQCDASLDAPFCASMASLCGYVNGVVLASCPFTCGLCTHAPSSSPSMAPVSTQPSGVPSFTLGPSFAPIVPSVITTDPPPTTEPPICKFVFPEDCISEPDLADLCFQVCSQSSSTTDQPAESSTVTSEELSNTSTVVAATTTAQPSTTCDGSEDPLFCDNFKSTTGCSSFDVADSPFCPIIAPSDCASMASSIEVTTKQIGEFAISKCPVLCNSCSVVSSTSNQMLPLTTTASASTSDTASSPPPTTPTPSVSPTSPSSAPSSKTCHGETDSEFCTKLNTSWCGHSAIPQACPLLCNACPETATPTTPPTKAPTTTQTCNGQPDKDICFRFFAKNTSYYCSQLEVIGECPVLCGNCEYPDTQDPAVACLVDDPPFCASVGVCNPADTTLFNLCFKLCGQCAPTVSPTARPVSTPTHSPSQMPTTEVPTVEPTRWPTQTPTSQPSATPTTTPTSFPSTSPTKVPTASPSTPPTAMPTISTPTRFPTTTPSAAPTPTPTYAPTRGPTASSPTSFPSTSPTTHRMCIETVLHPFVYTRSGSKRRCHCSLDCNKCDHVGVSHGRCLQCKNSQVLDQDKGTCFDKHLCSEVGGVGNYGLVCTGHRDSAIVLLVSQSQSQKLSSAESIGLQQRLRSLGVGLWELGIEGLTKTTSVEGASELLRESVETNLCSRADGGSATANCEGCCGGLTQQLMPCLCGSDCHSCNGGINGTAGGSFCTKCGSHKALFRGTCISQDECTHAGYIVRGSGQYGLTCECSSSPDNSRDFNEALLTHAAQTNKGYYMSGPCSSFKRFCTGAGNVAKTLNQYCKQTCDLC